MASFSRTLTPSTRPTPIRPPRPASPSPSIPPRRPRPARPASMPSHALPFHTPRTAAPLPPLPPSAYPVLGDDDVSDCESDHSDDDDGASVRPLRSSFLAVRTSVIRPPRDEEEAAGSVNSSSSTLAGTPPLESKEFKGPKALLGEESSDPFESHGLDTSPLPPKKGPRFYRYLRWNFGSVYRRIFGLLYLGNMAALAVLIARHATSGDQFQLTYQQASIAVTANILAAMLVRNEHVVNAMFWVFGTWTKNLPLCLRTLAAKVYSYGGIHSSAAVAATFWYLAFLVLLTLDFQRAGEEPLSAVRSHVYFVSYFILFLLVSMLISAHPHLRRVMHNWFEGIHRFMGWLAVLLFWAQTMLLAADATGAGGAPFGRALLVSPNFWMLVAITLLVLYPWTRLRRREVDAEVLSQHCVKLNFKYRDVHYGQAIRLTDAPLKETHAFGVIPFPAAAPATPSHCPGCTCHHQTTPTKKDSSLEKGKDAVPTLASLKSHALTSPSTAGALAHAGERGFSVIISNAGDWTRKMIASPPTHIYTRGTPQFGVMRVAGLFTPCVVVATGSGIAPCLSLFVQHPGHPVRIIWSAKDPVRTFGRAVVELVYKTDPRAVVIDTSKGGKESRRPDLVRLAYRVREEGTEVGGVRRKGEAVVIISNQRVTKKVVYGLETRGVPAYGAIFDS